MDNSTQNGQNGNGAHTLAARAEEKVREITDTARLEAEHRVHAVGEIAQQRLESERDRVAARIDDAAARLRERGDAAGPIGHAAGEQVATRMEAAAGYLHEHPTQEIASDLAAYVRQHPIQSIVAAAFAGYVFGRLGG